MPKSNCFRLPVLPSVSSVSSDLVFRRTYIHFCMAVRWYKKVKCTLVQALRLCTGRTAHGGVEV